MSKANSQTKERAGPPILIPAALFALAMILGAVVWALTLEPPPLASCRLPGGTMLRLEAVTDGSRSEIAVGPYWQRLLAPVLPPQLQDRLGNIGRISGGGNPNGIRIWAAESPIRSPTTEGDLLFAEIIDEHGCVFGMGGGGGAYVSNGRVLAWQTAPAFPRRAKRVGVRVYAMNTLAGELMGPNPAYRSYPTWTPQPLPVTRREGNLAFTLTALTTQQTGGFAVNSPWTEAVFQITEDGKPTKAWEPTAVTLADATGNSLVLPYFFRSGQVGGRSFVAFDRQLCVEEPAWKLRFELVRVAHFDPADLWTARGVPVPKRGAIAQSAATAARHGASLKLLGIGSPGHSIFGEITYPGNVPMAYVQASSSLAGFRVSLVRAIDDRGREAPPIRSGFWMNDNRTQYSLPLHIPPGAKRVDLTFAVSRSRFVEFIVKPSRR